MNLQQIKMFIHRRETVLDLFSLFDHLKNLVHKSHSFMNHSTLCCVEPLGTTQYKVVLYIYCLYCHDRIVQD